MTFFAKNLRYLREKKGLSQSLISSEFGLSRTQWTGYEQGTTKPTFDMLIKIVNYFDISFDEVIKTDMTQNIKLEQTKSEEDMGHIIDKIADFENTLKEADIELQLIKKRINKTLGQRKK